MISFPSSASHCHMLQDQEYHCFRHTTNQTDLPMYHTCRKMFEECLYAASSIFLMFLISSSMKVGFPFLLNLFSCRFTTSLLLILQLRNRLGLMEDVFLGAMRRMSFEKLSGILFVLFRNYHALNSLPKFYSAHGLFAELNPFFYSSAFLSALTGLIGFYLQSYSVLCSLKESISPIQNSIFPNILQGQTDYKSNSCYLFLLTINCTGL